MCINCKFVSLDPTIRPILLMTYAGKESFLQKREGRTSYRPFTHDVTLCIWRTLRIIFAMGLLAENVSYYRQPKNPCFFISCLRHVALFFITIVGQCRVAFV